MPRTRRSAHHKRVKRATPRVERLEDRRLLDGETENDRFLRLSGYDDLVSELGSAMPTGQGVSIAIVEDALVDPSVFSFVKHETSGNVGSGYPHPTFTSAGNAFGPTSLARGVTEAYSYGCNSQISHIQIAQKTRASPLPARS